MTEMIRIYRNIEKSMKMKNVNLKQKKLLKKLKRTVNNMTTSSPGVWKMLELNKKLLNCVDKKSTCDESLATNTESLKENANAESKTSSSAITEMLNVRDENRGTANDIDNLSMKPMKVNSDSQCLHVINLKTDNNVRQDSENNFVSFPLELLTNTSFIGTDKQTESGITVDQNANVQVVSETSNLLLTTEPVNNEFTQAESENNKIIENGELSQHINPSVNNIQSYSIEKNKPIDTEIMDVSSITATDIGNINYDPCLYENVTFQENANNQHNMECDGKIDSAETSLIFEIESISSNSLPTDKQPQQCLKQIDNEIIVDETQYPNDTEATIFDRTNSKRSNLIIGSDSQSKSFLDFNAEFKSPQSLYKKTKISLDADRPLSKIGSASSLLLNNDTILKTTFNKNIENMSTEKRLKLENRIAKKRSVYLDKWSNMQIAEKVNSKFAKQFHVRIFDEPVDALLNISYKPNIGKSFFNRTSSSDILKLDPLSEKIKLMDGTLSKAVQSCVTTRKIDQRYSLATNGNDSDSSDEDQLLSTNRKWLNDYIQNLTLSRREKETSKGNNNCDSFPSMSGLSASQSSEEVDLNELLRKMGDCDWLNNY